VVVRRREARERGLPLLREPRGDARPRRAPSARGAGRDDLRDGAEGLRPRRRHGSLDRRGLDGSEVSLRRRTARAGRARRLLVGTAEGSTGSAARSSTCGWDASRRGGRRSPLRRVRIDLRRSTGTHLVRERGRLPLRLGSVEARGARFERTPLPESARSLPPRALFLDAAEQLWLGPYVGLLRRTGETVRTLEPCEGLEDLQTRCFFEDRRGRLWIGTRFHGVSVTDEPTAERPRFRNYSTATGLASDAVWSIAEDEDGRIYLATSRGIERIDANAGPTAGPRRTAGPTAEACGTSRASTGSRATS
jgi:hypothetical protein